MILWQSSFKRAFENTFLLFLAFERLFQTGNDCGTKLKGRRVTQRILLVCYSFSWKLLEQLFSPAESGNLLMFCSSLSARSCSTSSSPLFRHETVLESVYWYRPLVLWLMVAQIFVVWVLVLPLTCSTLCCSLTFTPSTHKGAHIFCNILEEFMCVITAIPATSSIFIDV